MTNIFSKAKDERGSCLFCTVPEEMVVKKTENFNVILDSFPLSKGHLLISSVRHFSCAGELPNSLFNEFNILRQECYKKYENVSLVGFEHGRSGGCQYNIGKCEHFHFHIIPGKLSDNIENLCSTKSKWSELPDIYMKHGEYLLLDKALKNEIIFYPTINHRINEHFFRTKYYQENPNCDGKPNWQHMVECENLFHQNMKLVKKMFED